MNKQSLYSAKYKWLQRIRTVREAVNAATGADPYRLRGLSLHIYQVAARGEELWDYAWALKLGPDYLYHIADHLALLESFSDQVNELAKVRGIPGCRKYINLKCEPRLEVSEQGY